MSGDAFPKCSPHRFGRLSLTYFLNSCAVTAFWLYYLSQGFQSSGILDGFYEIQAMALSRCSLAVTPGPLEFFYHDVCIYKGSYYFYWGLLPAYFYLCVSTVLGRLAAHYVCAAAFLFSLVYSWQLIIALVVRVASKDSDPESVVVRLTPAPLLWLFLFSLPFHEPGHWFYARFVIYEQAIVFGLAFAMPAVYFAILGFSERRSSYICVSALLLSLAAWTRGTWLAPACLAIVLAVYAVMRFRREPASTLMSLAERACLVCSVLLLLGLPALNYTRFDSPWDFGLVHQDSQLYVYQRGIARLFSLDTRWWTFVTNLLLYYGPMSWVTSVGLVEKSASVCEGVPPGFFASAPQFLVIAMLTPYAVYQMRKEKPKLIVPFLVVGIIALFLSIQVAAFGTMVIPRYFVECYFFVLICMFIILLSLFPRLYGVVVMFALLAIYIPFSVGSFAKVVPELRLLDPIPPTTESPNAKTANKVFFIERNVAWPQGSVSTQNGDSFRRYNLIGLRAAATQMLAGEDVATAYIIPSSEGPGDVESGGCVAIDGLHALATEGTVGVFIDARQVGQIPLRPGLSVDSELCFRNALGSEGPTHVMLAFFPGQQAALNPRPLCSPCFAFRKLRLQRR